MEAVGYEYITGTQRTHRSSTRDGKPLQELATLQGLSLATRACLAHRWDRAERWGGTVSRNRTQSVKDGSS